MAKTPIYVEVCQKLKWDFVDEQAGKRCRLPAERELQERYQVSRNTISKALTLLEAQGLLVKEQGRGTFLRGRSNPIEDGPSPVQNRKIGFVAPLWTASSEPRARPLVHQILMGVEYAARLRQYTVLIGAVGDQSVELERHVFQDLCDSGAAGIVIHPVRRYKSGIEDDYLRNEFRDIPVVMAGGGLPEQCRAQVELDNVQLGYEVMHWLISQGHRRIAFISPWPADAVHPALDARIRGFCTAMSDAGIQPADGWMQSENGERIGVIIGNCLEAIAPTAIIGANDVTAIEVIQELERRGIWVPENITVTGFDNMPEAANFEPAFPTTNPDYVQLGRRAADMILDAIEGNRLPEGKLTLPAPLHIRSSIRARPVFKPQGVSGTGSRFSASSLQT